MDERKNVLEQLDQQNKNNGFQPTIMKTFFSYIQVKHEVNTYLNET